MAVAAAEDREKSGKVEQAGDHRTEIVSGSGLRDQQLAHWPTFGEREEVISWMGPMIAFAHSRATGPASSDLALLRAL